MFGLLSAGSLLLLLLLRKETIGCSTVVLHVEHAAPACCTNICTADVPTCIHGQSCQHPAGHLQYSSEHIAVSYHHKLMLLGCLTAKQGMMSLQGRSCRQSKHSTAKCTAASTAARA
jgi:hypothetical protein